MKSLTVWNYVLRTETGRWLADVVLRSDGFFATVSDWGNYAFRWTHPGMEFRAFVAKLSSDYVCSKLTRREWWDGERTLRAIKEHICSYRRDGSYSKEKAAREWQNLRDVFGGSMEDFRSATEIAREEFTRRYDTTRIGDAWEFVRVDYHPDVRGFCREVMPVLAAAIRAELAGETAERAELPGDAQ